MKELYIYTVSIWYTSLTYPIRLEFTQFGVWNQSQSRNQNRRNLLLETKFDVSVVVNNNDYHRLLDEQRDSI
jgi:hypothetical protein